MQCVSVVTKSGVESYLNLMTWQAVAKPDFQQTTPSLPIAGGTQTLTMGHTVFSVCVHPSGQWPLPVFHGGKFSEEILDQFIFQFC